MARLAEYLRRSTLGEEDKNYSIENQHDDIVRWMADSDHSIVKTYSDPGGKSYTLYRPVFQQMMADAKAGLFDVVVVGKWDRFSRIQDQQAVAVYQLNRYGVKVVSATQPTPEGAVGTLLRNSYAFASEVELYNTRDRTTGGRKKRTRNGKILPAPFPLYGYIWPDEHEPHGKSRYIPDMESIDGILSHAAAEVVRWVFQLLVSGLTLHKISQVLAKEGVPTPSQLQEARGRLPKGKVATSVWRISTLRRILTNPAYIGRHSAWRMQMLTEEEPDRMTGQIRERAKLLERSEDNAERVFFTEDACPALVSEEVFKQAQVVLRRNQNEACRSMYDPEAALLRHGFAYCGHCGNAMKVRKTGKNRLYRYGCGRLGGEAGSPRCPGGGHSITAATLDDAVWRWIIRNFEHPEILRAKFDQWKVEQIAGKAVEYDRLETVEALIKKAENRRRNYMRSEGDADDEEMRHEYHELALDAARQIRELVNEREQLQRILAGLETADSQVEELIQMGVRALDHLRSAAYDDKRAVLHAFGVRVTVWNKDHKPRYRIRWRFDELHNLWAQQHQSTCFHKYEFYCSDCRSKFEVLTSYEASQGKMLCATCHGANTRKLLSLVAKRARSGDGEDFGDFGGGEEMGDFGDDGEDDLAGGCSCGGACSCNN